MPERKKSIPQKKRRFTVPQRKRRFKIPSEEEENSYNVPSEEEGHYDSLRGIGESTQCNPQKKRSIPQRKRSFEVPSEGEGNSDNVPSEEEEPLQCYLREGGKDSYCYTTGCSVTNKTLKLQSITSEREVNFTV